jgi:hypothetical protein
MAASAINVILAYILTGIEALTPETYPAYAFKRWRGVIPFKDIDNNINHRAVQLSIEDGGNNLAARCLSGINKVGFRGHLVTRVLYGFEITEALNDDNQGLLSVMLEDFTKLILFYRSPTLFSGLSSQTIYRPVLNGFSNYTNPKGYPILELRHDFSWRQST